MFKEMRRFKQMLTEQENKLILKNNTNGILSVYGEDGYPYGVPVSYVLLNNRIYFHTAKVGHKVNAMTNHPNVSFTVVDQDKVIQETFTTHFRSVILFGKALHITDDAEMRLALKELVKKYSPDFIKAGDQEIESGIKHLSIYAIEIEHMTGKAAKELIKP